MLWSLIFAKCLTLEYLIQVYSVPINSFFYIWMLTLSMGGVATAVFFRTEPDLFRLRAISVSSAIWIGCGAISLLMGILLFLTSSSLYAWLTGFAITLGAGCIANGIIKEKHMLTLSGIGWWIGAAVLATHNNVKSLPVSATLIFFLLIIPLGINLRRQKGSFF